MGLIKLLKLNKEEAVKFEEIGSKAYAEQLLTNKEVYGDILEIDKKHILEVSDNLSKTEDVLEAVGKEKTDSIVVAGGFGIGKGYLYGIGVRYRNKKLKADKKKKKV